MVSVDNDAALFIEVDCIEEHKSHLGAISVEDDVEDQFVLFKVVHGGPPPLRCDLLKADQVWPILPHVIILLLESVGKSVFPNTLFLDTAA